jgi:hypothetical protein
MAEIKNVKEWNKKVMDEAATKLERLKHNYMVNKYLPSLMESMLMDFGADYNANNPSLTGNTYTGTTIGAYYNRSLIGSLNMIDLGAKPPTQGQTFVGDYGFYDYDSGEWIGPYGSSDYIFDSEGGIDDMNEHPEFVADYKNFKWQKAQYGKYAYQIAKEFLQAYKPTVSGYALVMVVGSEYSAWLEKVRGLDILTGSRLYAKYYVMNTKVKL